VTETLAVESGRMAWHDSLPEYLYMGLQNVQHIGLECAQFCAYHLTLRVMMDYHRYEMQCAPSRHASQFIILHRNRCKLLILRRLSPPEH
jgi:hypothetical protein